MFRALIALLIVASSAHAYPRFPMKGGLRPDNFKSTPQYAATVVHGDLKRTPTELQPYTRYFYLHNLPKVDRLRLARVLSGHNNGMSGEPELKAPEVVDEEAVVFRVNLKWYGWSKHTWDLLPDPYSTIQEGVKIHKAGIKWIDGRTYDYDFRYVKKSQKYIAPHLSVKPSSPEMITDIYNWTGSLVPMVRGDWFLAQTATQEGKIPGYYDFLGVKNEKDFQALVRFDAKLGDKTEHSRVAPFSKIAHQPRLMTRINSTLGGYWVTFDNEKATGQNNPLVFIRRKDLKFDITEQIGVLLNEMPAWYVGDNKGNRADKALDNIVGGDFFGIQYAPEGAVTQDTRLHVNISCISCHFSTLHENGIKDLNEAQVKKITEPDYDLYLELTREYLRNIKRPMEQDRNTFATAIRAATGWGGAEYAMEYRKAHSLYEYGKIDLKVAAAEMGVNYLELGVKLAGYDAATGNKLNPMLAMIKDGGSIPRRQWEEAFPEANRVYYSVNLVLKEEKK